MCFEGKKISAASWKKTKNKRTIFCVRGSSTPGPKHTDNRAGANRVHVQVQVQVRRRRPLHPARAAAATSPVREAGNGGAEDGGAGSRHGVLRLEPLRPPPRSRSRRRFHFRLRLQCVPLLQVAGLLPSLVSTLNPKPPTS
jgi:hypothetical protein